MKQRRPWLIWVLTLGIGGLITLSMLLSSRIFALTDPLEVYAAACDAFFVPGILLLSFGLLGLVSREGLFDIMGYGMRSLLVLFTPFGKPEKHERYLEYKERRAKLREKPQSNIVFLSGAIFMAAAAVCLAMYAMAGGM